MALAVDPLVLIDVDDPLGSWSAVRRLSTVVEAVGWDKAKENEDVRRFLQRLGTDGVRNHLGDNIWVDSLFRRLESYEEPSARTKVVITDVRFPNEADAIRQRGGEIWR